MRLLLAGLAALCLSACVHSPPDDPQDPFEGINRAMYGFNETLDEKIARPIARGYVNAVPDEIRGGVGNFFRNVTYPTVIINDVLQGKLRQSGRDTTRFLLNTTFGLVGFLDPATLVGLERNDEDFGQTLGVWGLGQGAFVMLPFVGPTTLRDGTGQLGNGAVSPLSYTGDEYALPLYALSAVNSRAQLLGVERVVEQQFDRYAFVRGAYLQNRLNKVYDGMPPRELMYGVEEE